MNFQPLTMQDIDIVRPFFSKLQPQTCDYSVGGMFMWRDFYHMEFSIENHTFFSRLYAEDGRLFYNIPLSDDIPSAISVLLHSVNTEKEPLRFCTVPEKLLPVLQEACAVVSAEEQPDFGDYLYRASDLIDLKGRKFSGQRNQISQFLRNVDSWSFDEIDPSSLDEVIAFFTENYLPSAGQGRYEQEENRKVLEVLNHYERYGMKGGLLRADGAVAGFSLNEILHDTLFTHIEKASRMCKGAYQMLVNQSAKRFASGTAAYINREEDLGDVGLRASKMAYHPVTVLKKYIVAVKEK